MSEQPVNGERRKLANAVIEREGYEARTAKIVIGLLVFLLVCSFTALAYGLREVQQVADSNQKVVCNLRAGYQEALKSNAKFLKANPNGGDLLGVHFTRDDLIKQQRAYKARLDSTEDAKC